MASGIKILDRTPRAGGFCFKCGTKVAAGSGSLAIHEASKKWYVCCTKDAQAEAAARAEAAAAERAAQGARPPSTGPEIGVDLSPDGRRLIWSPLVRLGDRFGVYRSVSASAGMRAEKDSKGAWYNYSAIPQAGNIHAALTDAGFRITVSPAAGAAISGAVEQQKATESATQTRLNHPNAAGLFPFQRVGVQWLAARQNGVLADEMGCGKTVQTLMALPDAAPVMLVVPSAVKLNWKKEAKRWRPEYKVEVLSGRNSFRWPSPGEMVIINYDILPKAPKGWRGYGEIPALSGVLDGAPQGLCIVADEAHMLKNSDTQRTKNFRLLRAIANDSGGSCWLLTGTPLLNRPLELWGIYGSGGVANQAFGSFDNFKRLFNATEGRWGIEWGDPEPEVPELMRRVQLRREKKDVLKDLPAKTRQYVTIPQEDAVISAAEKRLLAEAASKLPSDEELNRLMSQAQVTNAKELPSFPGFEEFSAAYAALARIKLAPTLKYLEQYIEEKQPFLVFAHHVDVLRATKQALTEKGLRCGLIIGDTSAQERQQIVDDFQAGRLDTVAVSIMAGGVGITLTRASNSIFLEPAVVPGLNVQAEDRVHRIGQTMPVTIRYMVLDHPFDERIQNLLRRKEELIAKTTEASTVLPTETVVGDENASALEEMRRKMLVSDVPVGTAREATQGGEGGGGVGVGAEPRKTVIYRAPDGKEHEVDANPQARPPRTTVERWAQNSLAILAAEDDDLATEKNFAGFSKATGRWGHPLNALAQTYGLTDEQWKIAIEIASTHQRQVGRAPRERDLRPEELSGLRGLGNIGFRPSQQFYGGLLSGILRGGR